MAKFGSREMALSKWSPRRRERQELAPCRWRLLALPPANRPCGNSPLSNPRHTGCLSWRWSLQSWRRWRCAGRRRVRLLGKPRVFWLGHHRERVRNALVGNYAQKRRLVQLCRKSLAQRAVEDWIAGGLREFGENYSVLVGQGLRVSRKVKPAANTGHDEHESSCNYHGPLRTMSFDRRG